MLTRRHESTDFPSDRNQHVYMAGDIPAGRGGLSPPASLDRFSPVPAPVLHQGPAGASRTWYWLRYYTQDTETLTRLQQSVKPHGPARKLHCSHK